MLKNKRILGVILALMLMFSAVPLSLATENDDFAISLQDPMPYVFPITQESPEWVEFNTTQERIDVCQVPEQKLKSMTTEALLATVMNYPFIETYTAFNSVEDACRTMSRDFNGFGELFSRPDITDELLNKYRDSRVLTSQEVRTRKTSSPRFKDVKAFFESATVEYLIACSEIINGDLSAKDSAVLSVLVEQKNEERDAAGIYSNNRTLYPISESGVTINRAGGSSWNPIYNEVVTPKGSLVPEVYTRGPELSSAEINDANLQYGWSFPEATRIADPTIRYNCHSYAFYQQSPSNKFWIGRENPPVVYITDGSYKKFTGIPSIGMKVWYTNQNHTGVSMGLVNKNGSQVLYVRSKWGAAGLYEHPYYENPYGTSVEYYVLA